MKNMISGTTKLTALLGSPVEHSISPAMHNEAFRLLGLDYAYLAFDVTEDTFSKAVDGLIALGAAGWNCTMPLKRLMHQRADVLSDTALLTGSVNTVVNRDGVLYGDNTDGYGFMQSMKDAGLRAAGKRLTVLGSGGAAASIIAQAALDGVYSIDIFSRQKSASTRLIEQEAELIRSKTACLLNLYDLKDQVRLSKSLEQSYCLINASSVGMAPNTEACLIPDASMLRRDLAVGDVIYNPRETALLHMAKEQGCMVFNGLYMLLHQGAMAFRLWTGQDMPVEEIREKFFQ
ncbi:MAG: shikimate dehydrogenase [Lachnospiraceae bacterium]|nr:shikimate dehydrogenase [Lachnospiraceae bacterium]MCI9307570.1 shikimate dehydrogenase [Lachnospiraceae bacterium]